MDTSYHSQDTVSTRLIIRIDRDGLLPDSVFRKMDEVPEHIRQADNGMSGMKTRIPLQKVVVDDTLSTCNRNNIADITFHDSLNFIRSIHWKPAGRVTYQSESENAGYRTYVPEKKLLGNLKEGEVIQVNTIHYDFVIIVIFFSAMLFLYVRSAFKNILSDLRKFFLFRGINEPSSRDIGLLFSWQSTLLNFITFLTIALFLFLAASYYNMKPSGMNPLIFALILLGTVVLTITIRHLLCYATGNLSGESDAFNEYLINVYQSYRYSSVAFFILILLITYTVLIPDKIGIITGFAVFLTFYVFRIIRLFLIFVKRDISILYLILYLCALEILPVLILIRYFTGLV